jgi:hypothetical protein
MFDKNISYTIVNPCFHHHYFFNEKKKKEFNLVKDLPILDVVAVFLAILSLLVTLFIATGIIRIHQTVSKDENLYEDDSRNKNGDKIMTNS